MKIITSKDLAVTAAARFKERYCVNNEWREYKQAKNKNALTYFKLVDLDNTITPQQVNKIIGNTSWTTSYCNCCVEQVECVVSFEPEDSADESVEICLECLKKANEMVGWIDNPVEYVLPKLALRKVKRQFLDSLDEFDRIEYGDCIVRDEEVQYVDSIVDNKVRLVLYKSDGQLVALNRESYLLENWKKIN